MRPERKVSIFEGTLEKIFREKRPDRDLRKSKREKNVESDRIPSFLLKISVTAILFIIAELSTCVFQKQEHRRSD